MDNIVELFNATMALGGKVSSSWQMFVAVNTAIFGWLVSKSSQHKMAARVVATLAYSVFALSMYKSLELSSGLYISAISDLATLASDKALFIKDSALQIKIVALGDNSFWREYWQHIYWVSAFGVGLFIYLDILSRHKLNNQ